MPGAVDRSSDEEAALPFRGVRDRERHTRLDRTDAEGRLRGIAPTEATMAVADRAVYGWIADECSKSTVKSSLAVT
ncbi:hypothetical protein KNE206_05100 [Kitasatospora sp. NE20-6]